MYDLAITIFKALIHIASPMHKKASLMVEGHKKLLDRIADKMTQLEFEKPNSKRYLFHCASLGEFEQGRPIIEAVRKREPGSIIIVTFFSPSGYTARHDCKEADAVFYLPFDTKISARRFAQSLKADIAIIIKYEYWRNIFSALHKYGTKIYIVSALFQDNMVFFNKLVGGFFISPLKLVDHFFVQDENSATLLGKLGFKNVSISGDTRFDRVVDITSAKVSNKVETLGKYIDNTKKIMVAGSVWESDMKRLLPFISSSRGIQFVIAPHNIDQKQIDRWISYLIKDHTVEKFSSLEKTDIKPDVIFIDCIGVLSQIYKFADVTFVGGGYDKLGIHNVLEPAVWNKPVIFGPVYSRYIEAVGLVKCSGAFPAKTTEEIAALWNKLTQQNDHSGEIAGNFVRQHSGVTERIMTEI